jgi:hypothetical protein
MAEIQTKVSEPESGTLGGFMILVVAITILYFLVYWIGSLFLEYACT